MAKYEVALAADVYEAPVADPIGGPVPDFIPTDPGFPQQWHLQNTSFPGVDLNVVDVWDEFTGAGVTVGVIDDGVEHIHPDLDGNYRFDLDGDFRDGDDDAAHNDSTDGHGTAVAGMIGAEADGAGLVGVSFGADIAGLRIGFGANGNNAQIVSAFNAARDFDIVNNSWGFGGFFGDNLASGSFAAANTALVRAVEEGRDGRGTVVVFAAGNEGDEGQDVNYHGFQNSPHTIAVGAIEIDGDLARFTTPGAAVLTSAPGVSVLTTDRLGSDGFSNGDQTFISGTSFSAPAVAGVVALMLEANSELGYRDVQEILALSSRNPTPADTAGWQTNGADFWNGGGLTVHDGFGFGLADAHAAVRLAETWEDQSNFANRDFVTDTASPGLSITDNSEISSTITLDAGDFAIDHVLVDVRIDHTFIGDLIVTLTSPDGTVSTLVNRPGQGGAGQNNIRFELTSVQYWGEVGTGDWTLRISDNANQDIGVLQSLTPSLLGDVVDDDDTYYFTDEWAFLGADAGRRVLSDASGTDVINAAAVSSAITFDLTPGAVNSLLGHSIELDASSEFENFIGGDGDDIVRGNSGDNVLEGKRGDDILIGGGGIDLLIGGAGADTFIYEDVSGSIFGAGDAISGFSLGADELDFAAVDANTLLDGLQQFFFIGEDAFLGRASELRFEAGAILGDVDGDAAADFEITLQGLDAISPEAFTAGSLATVAPEAAPPAPIHVLLAGDFDGDGGADLLIRDGAPGNLQILNGEGGFQSGIGFGALEVLGSGDVNGDGADNILLEFQDGHPAAGAIIAVDGAGAVTARYGDRDGHTFLGLADFDADDGQDLLFRNDANGNLFVLDGDGGFQVGLGGAGRALAGVADLNGDGAADILLAGVTGSASATVLQSFSGDGAFLTGYGDRKGATLEVIADTDGDGADDLVFSNNGNGNFFAVNGAGGFQRGYGFGGHDLLDAGDLDGDGSVDLLLQDQAGGLRPGVTFAVDGGGGILAGYGNRGADEFVGLADMDGDGGEDVIFRNLDTGGLFAFNGDGGFQQNYGRRGDGLIAIDDYNGDGSADILTQVQPGSPFAGHVFNVTGEGAFLTSFGALDRDDLLFV